MSPQHARWVKPLIPVLLIIVIGVLHSAEQQRGTVPACADSASCSGDLSQPLLELLLPPSAPATALSS